MAATTSSPLLERGDELAKIERILDAAIASDGGLLMVEGEAGAGKTSLLGACARLGAARGMRVLRARGGEYERDFPYGVVRQLFEPPLAAQADRAELLSGTAAMAAPVFSGEAGAPGGGEPFAMQHGLYWLLADLAEASPLLLAVDDAQWTDLASLHALAYIARRLEGLPVSLVLGVRVGEPGAHRALLDELRREPGVELVIPRPLAETAISELAARELGAGPSQRFAAACCRASAGNPFLVVELLRALAADGIVPSDPNADRLEEIAAAGVSRSILLRLGRLGETGVDTARAIAILEPNAELEHVAALTGLGTEDAAAACSRLIEARLLDSRPLGFVHPLIRSAVYADIPEPRRAVLHAAAAKRLADAGGSIDSVAAHLLLAAPAGERSVVETLRVAAREANERGAVEPAVGYLQRALAEPPPASERAAVERELASALVRASDAAGIETLLALRESSEDAVARAEIAAELAVSLTYRGRSRETVALLERSLAELDGSNPKLELRLRGELLELSLLDREGIPGWLLDGIEKLPGDSFEARRLLEQASFLEAFGLGSLERAADLARTATPDLDSLRADVLAGFPPNRSWIALVLADHGEEVERFFDTASDAARYRNINAVASNFGTRAFCRILDGDLAQAQSDAERALELALPVGLEMFTMVWRVALVWALVERGELDVASGIVDRDIREELLGPGLLGGICACVRGHVHGEIGDYEASRRDFLAAGERVAWLPYANPEGIGWRTGLATAEAALGKAERAGEMAREAVDLAREAGGPRGIGVALRVQGVVAGAEGVEVLREAVETLAGTRARLQHARALVDLGATLRRGNRRKEAREPLREGLDIAHRCGAAALEERARTELAATGARPRSAVLSGVDSLTPSELRVAGMAAEGMTNREVAQQLYVTAKTVETHLRHAYQKLDVARRAELAAALRQG